MAVKIERLGQELCPFKIMTMTMGAESAEFNREAITKVLMEATSLHELQEGNPPAKFVQAIDASRFT